MTDRYRGALDSVRSMPVPDVWDDALRRAHTGDDAVRLVTVGSRRRRGSRLVMVAAGVGVAVIVGAVAVLVGDDGTTGVVSRPDVATTVMPSGVEYCGGIGVSGLSGAQAVEVPTASGSKANVEFEGRGVVAQVVVPAPAVSTLADERTESIALPHGSGLVWYRNDGAVAIRGPTELGAPCDTFEVLVPASVADDPYGYAVGIAGGLAFHLAGPPQNASSRCSGTLVGFVGLPGAGPFGSGQTVEFEGDSVEIRVFDEPTIVAPQPTVGADRTGIFEGAPAVELAVVAEGTVCYLVLRGDARGVGVVEDLADGGFLADSTGAPALDPYGAVWPETAQSVVAPAPVQPWRNSPEDVALEFAREVLGWEDAAVGSEPSEDGRFGTVLGLERTEHPGSISVSLARTLGGRWWGVYRVGFPCCVEDQFASVSVNAETRTGSASAGPAPLGTTSTRVRFDHGGRVGVASDSGGEPFDLGYAPDTTGSVLVLFLDASGEVIGGWGTPLRAGDFAAG